MALPSVLLRFRNKLLADPKFLAFAQRFLLTRPVARKKSVALFDLLAGFSYSQVLYACVGLRVFEHVGLQGENLDELAAKLNLPVGKTEILVKAAVALDLLAWDRSRVALGPHGAALLGQPWIMRFVEHHKHFYRDLENPIAMLRGEQVEGGLRSYWSYGSASSDKAPYSALMQASQQAVSEQVINTYNFARHTRILDVGGGSGAFLQAVGRVYPQLERHVFDLPGVIALTTDTSLKTHGGDFHRDDLPQGMDIISLVRVVHDHDDAVIVSLLQNIRRACSKDTILLIAEPFAGNPATARVTDAYFNFYFTAMGQGLTRTPAEIAALGLQAGFETHKTWRTDMPLIAGVMTLLPRLTKV